MYLYLFKKHRQTFSSPGESPSSHVKVTKMWFGPNMKYLSEPLFGFLLSGRYLLLRFALIDDPVTVDIILFLLCLVFIIHSLFEFCHFSFIYSYKKNFFYKCFEKEWNLQQLYRIIVCPLKTEHCHIVLKPNRWILFHFHNT